MKQSLCCSRVFGHFSHHVWTCGILSVKQLPDVVRWPCSLRCVSPEVLHSQITGSHPNIDDSRVIRVIRVISAKYLGTCIQCEHLDRFLVHNRMYYFGHLGALQYAVNMTDSDIIMENILANSDSLAATHSAMVITAAFVCKLLTCSVNQKGKTAGQKREWATRD